MILHICPACGKNYELPDGWTSQSGKLLDSINLPCSKKCEEHLEVLEAWLQQRREGS